MLTLEINDADLCAGLSRLAASLKAPRGLMRALAGVLESETEANFAAHGRSA